MKISLWVLSFVLQLCIIPAVAQNGLNESQIREIVEKHNYWRSQLGIAPVKWSAEVARYAQDWAEKLALQGCQLRHRQNGKYGENIFWVMGLKITPSNVVDDWASERKDFNHNTQECNGNGCGHYTQVIWSSTNQIGCGMARCKDGAEVWVCNYDPPGNYMGEKPYNPNGSASANNSNSTNTLPNSNADIDSDENSENESDATFLNIKSLNSEQCLNVKGSMTNEGSPVILWQQEENPNSKWHVEQIDGSISKITVLHSGLCLTVNRRVNSLETSTFANTRHQLWDIQPTEGGVLIKSLATQLYLAIKNGRITWVRNNQGNIAVWKIE